MATAAPNDTAPIPVPFRYHKNLLHLYDEFVRQIVGKSDQGEIADRIKMNEGTFSKFLQRDYLDLGPKTERRLIEPYLRRIDDDLRNLLKKADLEIQSVEGRSAVERALQGYQYPDREDIHSNQTLNRLRGVWQLFSPSERLSDRRSDKPIVRISCLLFYGFVPARAKQKKYVDVIWVGRTTVWKAQAFVEAGQNLLYVYAQECSTQERKFFSFYAPELHDSHRRSRVTKMAGVMAGTVLDDDYKGDYPAVATPCIARKLNAWSEWFDEHDTVIDGQVLAEIKKEMFLNYRTQEEFKREAQRLQSGASRSGVRRSLEWFKDIDIMLNEIVSSESSGKIYSIVIGNSRSTPKT